MAWLRLIMSVLFLVACVALVVGSSRAGNVVKDGAPRARKRQQRYSLLLLGAMLAQNAWMLLAGRDEFKSLIMINLPLLGVTLLWMLYTLPSPPSEAEARANYRARPEICGRCDYDLTGNHSGVCSECGWRLCNEPLPQDAQGWERWWRGWRIASLENWRRTLRNCVDMACAAILGGVAVAMLTPFWTLAGPAALLAAHAGINVVRVAAYGGSRRGSEAQGTKNESAR